MKLVARDAAGEEVGEIDRDGRPKAQALRPAAERHLAEPRHRLLRTGRRRPQSDQDVGFDDLELTYPDTPPPPDFSLSVGGGATSVAQGDFAEIPIGLNRVNGSNGDIALSASGLPPGMSASFAPNPAAGTEGGAMLKLSADPNAPPSPNSYSEITITATPGSGAGAGSPLGDDAGPRDRELRARIQDRLPRRAQRRLHALGRSRRPRRHRPDGRSRRPRPDPAHRHAAPGDQQKGPHHHQQRHRRDRGDPCRPSRHPALHRRHRLGPRDGGVGPEADLRIRRQKHRPAGEAAGAEGRRLAEQCGQGPGQPDLQTRILALQLSRLGLGGGRLHRRQRPRLELQPARNQSRQTRGGRGRAQRRLDQMEGRRQLVRQRDA